MKAAFRMRPPSVVVKKVKGAAEVMLAFRLPYMDCTVFVPETVAGEMSLDLDKALREIEKEREVAHG